MAVKTGKLLQTHLNAGVGAATAPRPGGGTVNDFQIGVHSFAIGQKKTTVTFDPGSVAHGSSVSTTVSVAGSALGDFVDSSFSLDLQGMTLSGYVSAAGVVTIVFSNLSGSSKDLASGTLAVLVSKSR